MLTVASLRSTSGDYYLAHYEGPEPSPQRGHGDGRDPWTDSGRGRWVGAAARPLGLRGPVRRAELEQVLDGHHPRTAWPLRSRTRVEVSGYDLCFSAPKSVSILWGTAPPEVAEVIVRSHRAAVGGALGYVERRALAARRWDEGDRTVISTYGLVGACFDHGASRAGDPHLHTHVVVPNLVHGVDGRWTVADGRGLFAHVAAAGTLYEAELRWEALASPRARVGSSGSWAARGGSRRSRRDRGVFRGDEGRSPSTCGDVRPRRGRPAASPGPRPGTPRIRPSHSSTALDAGGRAPTTPASSCPRLSDTSTSPSATPLGPRSTSGFLPPLFPRTMS